MRLDEHPWQPAAAMIGGGLLLIWLGRRLATKQDTAPGA